MLSRLSRGLLLRKAIYAFQATDPLFRSEMKLTLLHSVLNDPVTSQSHGWQPVPALSDQYPVWHLSQSWPVTPGRHTHWPVNVSQGCIAPDSILAVPAALHRQAECNTEKIALSYYGNDDISKNEINSCSHTDNTCNEWNWTFNNYSWSITLYKNL